MANWFLLFIWGIFFLYGVICFNPNNFINVYWLFYGLFAIGGGGYLLINEVTE